LATIVKNMVKVGVALASSSLALGGCIAQQAPVVDLAHAALDGEVVFEPPPYAGESEQIAVNLWRHGFHQQVGATANPDDCVTIRATTTITGNGTAGELSFPGSYDASEVGANPICRPPVLVLRRSTHAAVLDIAIDDGSAQHRIQLINAAGGYQLSSCDFVACPFRVTH
jgi:hypothetical protein